jgi:hypothetical protein
MDREPFEIARVVTELVVTLRTESAEPWEWVTVALAVRAMTTSSLGPGRTPPTQLEAVPQSPPAGWFVLSQEMTESMVRASSHSTNVERKNRRRRDERAGRAIMESLFLEDAEL